MLNIFAGGALANLSLFALGIMPYITASIIIQLMQTVVPSLEKLSKEGESGYKKITQYTRYLTVVLAAFQSAGYVFLFHNGSAIGANDLLPDLTVGRFILIVTTLTAGTTLLMWMGELITQRGVGNGISLLIFASILTAAPAGDRRLAERRHVRAARAADRDARRDPRGRVHERGPAPHPDPVRQAPGRPPDDVRAARPTCRCASTWRASSRSSSRSRCCSSRRPWGSSCPASSRSPTFFAPGGWPAIILEFALIVMFTFLYTAVTFNPVDQADNLKKYGGFIPGVRPGAPTARYLDRVLTRLTLPGAIFLGLIAVLPNLFIRYGGFSQATARGLGGTSILIVVGVALDAMRQMESQLTMRHYEGVLKK